MYKRGEYVLIKKGARVTSYNPSKPEYILSRNQVVKVRNSYKEYTYNNKIHESEISWAGAGGYWCHTVISNIIDHEIPVENTLVKIEWKNPAYDWPWFYILKEMGDRLYLKGADYPDGSGKHNGDTFWVKKSEIKSLTKF